MSDSFRNRLYFGDNLKVLRGEFDVPDVPKIEDESVDLIYLDPPFNSQRNYNLLFKQQKGEPSLRVSRSHGLFEDVSDEQYLVARNLARAGYSTRPISSATSFISLVGSRMVNRIPRTALLLWMTFAKSRTWERVSEPPLTWTSTSRYSSLSSQIPMRPSIPRSAPFFSFQRAPTSVQAHCSKGLWFCFSVCSKSF